MNASTIRSGPPLRKLLTQRLAIIATVVLVLNSLAVGIYYGSDRRELDTEVVNNQVERIEEELDGRALPDDAHIRRLYADHPSSYAFALVDRSGTVLETMNPELVPPVATDIFADNWVTRLDRPGAPLLVAGHEFQGRSDGLRLVFVMRDDPARLLWRAYLDEFYEHVWLPILPLVILLIGATTLLIRSSLAPISDAAAWARNLRPGDPTPPPDAPMPAEIADLVDATQRSVEKLAQALAAEKRLAAEAAHALRTPIAVLVARLDALPPGDATDNLRADLSALSRTVRQLLASARADTLSQEGVVTVDLCASAKAVTAALAPFAYANGRDISLDAPDGVILAQGDGEGVELALTNLIENAIVHGDGPVEITVGPGTEISVRDHGSGLPAATRGGLFDPFWRGPDAAPGGTGLGLAIVKRVQFGFGGTVEATNALGGGAMFKLSFLAA